jgi:hypothetical protein
LERILGKPRVEPIQCLGRELSNVDGEAPVSQLVFVVSTGSNLPDPILDFLETLLHYR